MRCPKEGDVGQNPSLQTASSPLPRPPPENHPPVHQITPQRADLKERESCGSVSPGVRLRCGVLRSVVLSDMQMDLELGSWQNFFLWIHGEDEELIRSSFLGGGGFFSSAAPAKLPERGGFYSSTVAGFWSLSSILGLVFSFAILFWLRWLRSRRRTIEALRRMRDVGGRGEDGEENCFDDYYPQ
ncbi:hypothetical protein HID58_051051 [Brassica napus]|uniref:Uncharacterized protein n=1 Tax=Brassica napus TaxID=3708 RepID=A0ABQ8A8J1_BRANA|nr:hypothetical protein HID58_051051 [Brassica napus]